MKSIGWGVFDRVVARRQALVAAIKAEDAAMEADPCARRCKCGLVPPFVKATDNARAALADAEESYRTYRIAFAC